MLGSVPVELTLSLWRRRVDCYNKKSICRAVKEGLITRVPLDFSKREIAHDHLCEEACALRM